jgi:hypothetical protein
VLRTMASWPLWREPRAALALIVAVELSALAIPAFSWKSITHSDIEVSTTLAFLSISYSVFTCSAERVRRTLHQGTEAVKYQNLLAIWGYAAAVLLPLPLVWITVVASGCAEWPARNVAGRARLYRHVYNTAVAVLAAAATHVVGNSAVPQGCGLALAASTYMAVGIFAVTAVMVVAGERGAVKALLQPNAHRVEFLSIAISMAVVLLAYTHLGMLIWLSLPAAVGLQRATTRSRLRRVADEAQVKPMTQEAWLIAAHEVVAALPVAAVMRIDTKEPAAVSAVAQIQAGCDAIGFLGKDGLGILLVDCPALSADALASRVRTALRHHDLEASVAAAAKPRDGYRLDDLLAVCEAELIARDAANRSARPSRPEA